MKKDECPSGKPIITQVCDCCGKEEKYFLGRTPDALKHAEQLVDEEKYREAIKEVRAITDEEVRRHPDFSRLLTLSVLGTQR